MRVVDRQQLFTALAHGPLGGEQIFRRGFISDQRIGRDVSQAIECSGFAVVRPADQAAAFSRSSFTRMRDYLVKVKLDKSNSQSARN